VQSDETGFAINTLRPSPTAHHSESENQRWQMDIRANVKPKEVTTLNIDRYSLPKKPRDEALN
jgi:hypothetical protein